MDITADFSPTTYPGLNMEERNSIGMLISFLSVSHRISKTTEEQVVDRFLSGVMTREDLVYLLKHGTALRPYSEALAFQQPESSKRLAIVNGIGTISMAMKALNILLDAR